MVSAEPQGTNIYVNGQFRATSGKTPVAVDLTSGENTLRFSHPDFLTAERKVSAAQGQHVDVSVKLAPVTGKLSVSGANGATIRIDGQVRGKSPLTVDLLPGDHAVQATRGQRSRQQRVIVEGEKRVDVAFNIPPANEPDTVLCIDRVETDEENRYYTNAVGHFTSTFTPDDSEFTVQEDSNNSIRVNARGPRGTYVTLEFSLGEKQEWQLGTFGSALGHGPRGPKDNVMEISSSDGGLHCRDFLGTFTILEMTVTQKPSPYGRTYERPEITSFAVDFEQVCVNGKGRLGGFFRYNSAR